MLDTTRNIFFLFEEDVFPRGLNLPFRVRHPTTLPSPVRSPLLYPLPRSNHPPHYPALITPPLPPPSHNSVLCPLSSSHPPVPCPPLPPGLTSPVPALPPCPPPYHPIPSPPPSYHPSPCPPSCHPVLCPPLLPPRPLSPPPIPSYHPALCLLTPSQHPALPYSTALLPPSRPCSSPTCTAFFLSQEPEGPAAPRTPGRWKSLWASDCARLEEAHRKGQAEVLVYGRKYVVDMKVK